MAFQEWAELLGKAGIRNVRLRSAQDSDKVGIETQGTPQSPIYVVTGVVRSRDELLLPGGRFRRSEVARLAQWLDDLAENGPAAGRQQKAAFGLSASQFDKIREDLATPVGFATQGMTCQQAVQKMAERLKLPLKLETEAARALADEKLDEDLSGLSCGTALAYVLRLAGYGLLPHAAGYAVVKARADIEVWPVGWTPETPPQQGGARPVRVPQRERAERVGRHGFGYDRQAAEDTRVDRPHRLGAARHRSGQGDGLAAPQPDDVQSGSAKTAVSGGDEVRGAA